MSEEGCIFCKIVKNELPSSLVYDNQDVLGFNNIRPEALTHLIFIPKRHIEWKDEFSNDDLMLIGRIIATAKKVAKEKEIFEACKLIFNIGKTGHIPHIHLHLLGGWKGKIPMNNV